MLAYGVSNTQENVMWPEKLWVDFSQGQVLIVGERAEEVEETEERVIEQLGCSNLGNEGNSLLFGNFFSHTKLTQTECTKVSIDVKKNSPSKLFLLL